MSLPKQADAYRQSNVQAARLILSAVERYGGEQAALVVWARRVVGEKTQEEGTK